MKNLIDNTRASVGHSIHNELIRQNDRALYAAPDPDRYLHHGEELPAKLNSKLVSDVASIPQRIHPKLGDLTDLLTAVKVGVGRLDFTNLILLRIERKLYGALLDELIELRDPAIGPLLEMVQVFLTGVCRDIDDVLNPQRQEDLLEQSNTQQCGATARNLVDDENPSRRVEQKEGDSAIACMHCGRAVPVDQVVVIEDSIFCSIVCAAEYVPPQLARLLGTEAAGVR